METRVLVAGGGAARGMFPRRSGIPGGMSQSMSPVGALGRGILAGLAGTAAMTAAQTVYYKQTGAEGSTVPAEITKRIIRGVLQRDVDDDKTDTINNLTHWAYGTTWGALYGLSARRPTAGVAFALTVWGASLIELPAMQLSPPIWKLPPSSIAPDLGFHLVYGVAAATAHRMTL